MIEQQYSITRTRALERDAAQVIEDAVEAVTADRSLHTRDLGGTATTAQVTDAVCRHLQASADRKAA